MNNREEEAKFYRDKHVIETVGKNNVIGDTFDNTSILGISQENKEKLLQEQITQQEIEEEEVRGTVTQLIALKKREEASEIVVEYIMKDNYIYTTKDDNKNEMYIYDNGIYVKNGKSSIKEIIRRLLGPIYTPNFCNLVIEKIEADTYIDQEKLFSTIYKDEIPVLNGILNVRTRELKDFSPYKIFFNKLPVRYDPLAECPMIESFLKDVLRSEDDIKVYYELGGFCLYKEYTFEKAFMFHGNGRNGKGKSLELIKRVVGVANSYSLPLSALRNENANVSGLFGKMINMAGDIDNKDLKDTSMFKSLTGRDLMTLDRKYLNAISFENYAKFIFACNDLPMVYDTSKGFWDRWVLLDFPYYFATKEEWNKATDEEKKLWKIRDEEIIDKISTENELSGLLNQFLKGLERLMENRQFSLTKGTEEIKETWIRRANSFVAFCMDNIEEDLDSYIEKKEMRKKYRDYCREHRVNGKSDIVIKITLQEHFGAMDDVKYESILGTNDMNKKYIWTGVKWKS